MIELRVCIDVDDLDQGIRFYREAFGLELGRRLGPGWAELLGATSPIDLLCEPSGSRASSAASATRDYARHWTPVHIDVMVDDLERAVDRARAAGATVERDIESRPYGRIAWLADPFGHGLCLIEMRGRGYDEIIEPASGSRPEDGANEPDLGPPGPAGDRR
jgi:predicted enzyme related to lactoylglutathione lyase